MKVYKLYRKQFLAIGLQEAWDFFSSPKNLAKITPSKMNFRILEISGKEKMHEGQVIKYKIKALPFLSVYWVTEIMDVQEPFSFIDDQRTGPFKLWRHLHTFKEVEGGVEMTDEVSYAIPFGPLGLLVHWLFVGREVNGIFNHRFETLQKQFQKKAN